MSFECRKIKKPFFCTAKVTIVLMLANIMFLTYVYANEENYVNVVSARQEYLIKPIFEEFTKDTRIKVVYIIDDANKMMKMIATQGEDTQVDAFLAVDAGDLYFAQQMGIFQPIRSRVLDRNIPSHLKDPSRYWFGLSLRVRSVAYHEKRVNPLTLSTYESLSSPQWKNKLAVRTSKRVYNKSMVAMMIAQLGYEKTKQILKGWVNNFAGKPLQSDVEVLNKILNNEADIGIVNSYYLAKMIKDNPELPLKMHWVGAADSAVHVNISGMGITRYSKRKKNAILLLEWMSSKKGQKLFADMDMEYPTNRSVKPHKILQEWGRFKQVTLNVKKAGELRAKAIVLMKEVGYE